MDPELFSCFSTAVPYPLKGVDPRRTQAFPLRHKTHKIKPPGQSKQVLWIVIVMP